MAASWPLVLTLAAFLPALAVPPISERYALYGIYNLTNGKAWTNSTNWYTYHSPCEWAGVSCDPNGSHVLGLNLTMNNLVGTLYDGIGNLSRLSTLVLRNNTLSGTLPASLVNCSLMTLDVSRNLFKGALPRFIENLSNLTTLDISNNRFSNGSVNFSRLVNLQSLDIGNNLFQGTIPMSLSTLKHLEVLDIHSNAFGGTFPGWLSSMSSLRSITLGSNGFYGELPAGLYDLNLTHLDVFNNAFNGSISADIINMASLEYLNIAENQFRTVLPDTIANLSSLKFVSTVDNCMEVNTPPDVWSWCIQPDANRSCYLVPQSVCTSLTPTISETMSVTPTFSATTTDSTTDSSTESSTYTSSASASGTQTVSRTATFSSSPSFVMTSPYYNKGLSQGGVAGVVLGVIGISASCVVGVWCRYQREKDARRAARANERRLRAVEKEAKRRQRKVDITPDVGPLRLTVPEGLQPEQEVRSRTYLAPSTANPSGLHSSDRLDHDTADDDRLSTGFPEVELVSPDAADRTPTRRLRPQPAIRSAMRKSEGSIKSNATSTSPARSPYPSAPATSTPSKPRTAERSPVSVGRKQRRYEMTGNPNIV